MKDLTATFGRHFVICGYLPAVAFLFLLRILVVPHLPATWQTELTNLSGTQLGADLALYVIGPLVLGSLLVSLSPQIIRLYKGDYWPFLVRKQTSEEHYELAAELHKNVDEMLAAMDAADSERVRELRGDLSVVLEQLHRMSGGVLILEPNNLKPTRLGNVLAAMEEYPDRSYGMVAALLWPRLLGVIPKEFQARIKSQNTDLMFLLNLSASCLVFAVAWVVLGIGSMLHWTGIPTILWWSVLVGVLAGVYVFYRLAVTAAMSLAESVMSAFDLYRGELCKQYRITAPSTADAESAVWRRLGFFIALGDRRFYPPLASTHVQKPEAPEDP